MNIYIYICIYICVVRHGTRLKHTDTHPKIHKKHSAMAPDALSSGGTITPVP